MKSKSSELQAGNTSRRSFLQQLGLGSSLLGLGVLGGLTIPQTSFAACEPPGTPGTPARHRRDCRQIRPRRPATTLSSSEVLKLRDAYKAMRALSVSDPSDPRGFTHQANVHCWYCGEGTQIHGSWQFFTWHRAYLYFHERILGRLINDPDLRLPYWDWETPSHRRLPVAYSTPNDTTNSLSNSTRTMSATDEIPEEDVGDDVMDAALNAGAFAEFGGTATAGGIPEYAPHGSVHVDVGGNMGAFATAARDPIFFAHHANLDKMWSDWIKQSSTHLNPSSTAFLNLSWNFYDENKVWRSITAAQVLNHESQLRYTYGPSRFFEILPCLLDWVIVRTDWRVAKRLNFTPALKAQTAKLTESGGRTRVHFTGLELPMDRSAVYRVYTSAEAAKADPGPGSEPYLGSIPIVLTGHEKHRATRRAPNAIFTLSKKAIGELTQKGTVQPAIVERGVKDGARKVILVRATDVHFSQAGVAR